MIIKRTTPKTALNSTTALAAIFFATTLTATNLAASTISVPDREQQLKLVQTKGCATCHGTKGQGNPGMKGPKLAGQSAEELTEKMKAYQDGTLKNPTMAMMTYSLSDEDIKALAAYFSQFP